MRYDSELTSKEQAKRDLASLIRDCSRRIESAKKAHKQHDEAAHRKYQKDHFLGQKVESTQKVGSKSSKKTPRSDEKDRSGLKSMKRHTTKQEDEKKGKADVVIRERPPKDKESQDKIKDQKNEASHRERQRKQQERNQDDSPKVYETDLEKGKTDFLTLSAPKPRQLLAMFSQSSSMVDESYKSVTSSQKKVRWQEDNVNDFQERTETGRASQRNVENKRKKSHGGNHSILSNSAHTSSESRRGHIRAKTASSKSNNNANQNAQTNDRRSGDVKRRRGMSRHNSSVNPNTDALTAASFGGEEGRHSTVSGVADKKSKSRSKRKSDSALDTSSMKSSQQSSGISSGEQRATKRRRNGAMHGLSKSGASKSSGVGSYGDDVAFSF